MDNTAEIEALTAQISELHAKARELQDRRAALGWKPGKKRRSLNDAAKQRARLAAQKKAAERSAEAIAKAPILAFLSSRARNILWELQIRPTIEAVRTDMSRIQAHRNFGPKTQSDFENLLQRFS
jgi:chromosome segregation ATPase